MGIIKYYNLESNSWEVVSGLEANLKRHLLSEKQIKGLLTASVEEIAEAKEGNGDVNAAEKLIVDSGEFDVLYRESNKTLENRGWFRKSQVKVSTELVVKASLYEFLELQNFLEESGLDIIEARKVTRGIFEYRRDNTNKNGLDSYKTHLQDFIGNNFSGLYFAMQVYPHRDSGCAIELCFSGDLEQVFQVRKYILSTEYECTGGFHMINFL